MHFLHSLILSVWFTDDSVHIWPHLHRNLLHHIFLVFITHQFYSKVSNFLIFVDLILFVSNVSIISPKNTTAAARAPQRGAMELVFLVSWIFFFLIFWYTGYHLMISPCGGYRMCRQQTIVNLTSTNNWFCIKNIFLIFSSTNNCDFITAILTSTNNCDFRDTRLKVAWYLLWWKLWLLKIELPVQGSCHMGPD